jgi:hypothetical protein
MATKAAQVRELEKFIAAGDISSMAKTIEELHRDWDSLGAPLQKDVEKLEAVFLSMVNARVGSDS